MFAQNNGDFKSGKLCSIFVQVSKVITSMLQNLAYIYKTNNINYQVENYHTVIMRILSPIQLFNAEKERSGWTIFPQRKEDQQLSIPETKIKSVNWERNQEDGYESFSQPKQGQARKRVSHLGEGIENYLCKWASNRAKKGNSVQRRDIIYEACKLAEKKGIVFQGSSGWYSRFLGRNPIVRNIVQGNKHKVESEGKYRQEQENSSSSPWKFEVKQQSSFIRNEI